MDKGDKQMSQKKQIPLLEVSDFSLTFRQYEQGWKEVELEVIHKLDVTIYEGEIVVVVGSSGSGKSLLADAILGILPENAKTKGEIYFDGKLLTEEEQRKLRGKAISLIPQSVKALDPLMKTGKQVQRVSKDKKAKKRIKQEAEQKIQRSEEN